MRRRYTNADPAHRPHSAAAVWRWAVTDRVLGRRRREAPGPAAPWVEADLELVRSPAQGARLTWIGHSGFLIGLGGASVLVDPVFSNRIGGVYRRYCPPGLAPDQLPPIDAVLVTHNHYDHLDAPSIDALDRSVPAVVPDGLGRWMERRDRPVVELGWWRSTGIGPLEVTMVPARHWSRRRIADTNRSWWGGYVIRAGGRAVYHAGDTAWFEKFSEIGRRFGPLAAAMLPIGGYDPAWFMEKQHLNPAQAGEAWRAVGAEVMVPMHWGSFRLTDEPLSEPIRRLRAWWAAEVGDADGRLADLAVGGSVELGGPS